MTLLRLAQDNDGIITRSEALAGGCSSAAFHRCVVSGFLIPTFPGTYRVSAHPDSFASRARAAFKWGGANSVLSGGTVLALFGAAEFEVGPIELYVPSGKSHNGLRTRRLPPRSLPKRSVRGMACTSIERALLDACRLHPAPKVGRAMDEMLRRRLTKVDRLRSTIPDDRRGVSGAKTYSSLVRARDLDDETIRSELEARMLAILRRIKGHRFVPNFEVRGNEGRYFIDFAVPEALLAIECHSRQWHGAEQVTKDANRHTDLSLLGWTILYFTWDDVVFEPRRVQRQIEAFLSPFLPCISR